MVSRASQQVLPQLSVVVVEYFCMDRVGALISSLHTCLDGRVAWECVVASNSQYSRRDLRRLQARAKGAHVVNTFRNRGFAGGVNWALSWCRAPYVFLLNPDARLVDSRIPELIDILDANPKMGAIGPRITDSGGIRYPSCRRFPRPWTFLLVRSLLGRVPGAWRERHRYFMEDVPGDREIDVNWLSGSALILRKEALEDLGGMDEQFFLYMEEVDLCKRLGQAGWSVRYAPRCTVVHDAGSASVAAGLKVWNLYTRHHLSSLTKYFMKHGLQAN